MPRLHFPALIAAFLAVLAVVGAVNWSVDSKGALRGGGDWPAVYARAVLDSPHGLAWPPRQERAVKAALAAASDADCVVVGTSHMQMIRRDRFPAAVSCAGLANLWVTQGALEDVVSMLAAVVDKPSTRRVFIGVSPWLFKWSVNSGWTENAEAFDRARRRFGLARVGGASALDGLGNLLNGKYFQANIRALTAPGGLRPVLRPAADEDGSNLEAADNVMRPDGSMLMSRVYRAAHPLPWAAVADGSFMIRPPYIQPHAVADLRVVLAALQARGIAVTLVLAPYHPKVMAAPAAQALAAAEAQARALAAGMGGIEVVGGFDPRPFGLSEADFYDDMHLTEGGLVKAFSRR